MSSRTKRFKLLFSLLLGILFSKPGIHAQNDVTLYTPYINISVPPGESVDYTIEVINNGKGVENVPLSISGIPSGWNYTLKSGGYSVSQVSVLPGDRKSVNFRVEIPVQIEKGTYRFRLNAGSKGVLPLSVNVSKKGTFKTEFTCQQANMQGHSKSNFAYNAMLKNLTAGKQLYALVATAPPGWEVIFKANYKQATSVEIEPNLSTDIGIEINPPDNIEAGSYVIPVKASTNSTAAQLDLQVVISGSYNIMLTTPSGLLSSKITAGDTRKIDLIVNNTGSSVLSDINLSHTAPANWEVSFEPKKIDNLLAGKSAQVIATVKADKRAIPGDYETIFEAKTNEVSSKAAFRIFVRTPMIWGWIGVLIIAFAIGLVFYLFRKYGRR